MTASGGTLTRVEQAASRVVTEPQIGARRGPVRAVVAALRPRQWTKNLLLFAGVLFAAKLGDAARLVEAAFAFAAFCAASSAGYLLNDVRDIDEDALHPTKRKRPIASGELSPARALVLALLLTGGALLVGALLGPLTLAFLAAFLGLQVAYSVGLKRLVLVDVAVIAALFVVRAAAGAAAVHVHISPWLLICTALLSLFLGLAKRRGELVLVHEGSAVGRYVLHGYSLWLLDRLIAVVASATVVVYALYALTAGVAGPAMLLTLPFVVFGVGRYVLLVHREDLGEEPEQVLLADRPILLTVALWSATSALVLLVR